MMRSCDGKFDSTRGTFELMGCDILIDDTLKPYLLEMNTNPALFTGYHSFKIYRYNHPN